MNTERSNGDTLQYTNSSGGTLASGALVLQGTIVGVLIADIANGATGSIRVTRVHCLPACGTIAAAGVKLYLDTDNAKLTSGACSWKYAGQSWGAVASSYVLCKLAGGVDVT